MALLVQDTPCSTDAAMTCPQAGYCCRPAVDRAHREKLLICMTLERIADSLPHRVDRLDCLDVAGALVPLLRWAHRYEEDYVFPAYRACMKGEGEADLSTVRLKSEHVEDECYAAEVTETLMAIGHGAPIANPESVGFMLRGFFELVRRHIAFEREHVMTRISMQCPL